MALISTVDLGAWDYYIMTDNTAIWRVMNGLAAWFSGNMDLISNAAYVGALILLSMILFSAAVGKKGPGSATLGGWFFFMVLMGTTGTANVTNIYDDTVTVIDNVPALALVPAAVFSKAGYKILTSMETALAGPAGSEMTIKKDSFIGPLDLMLALRSPKVTPQISNLNQTLSQVVRDCGMNPNPTTTPVVTLNDSLDVLDWLKNNGRQTGLTRLYKTADDTSIGEVSSCTEAWIYLDDEYLKLADGTDPRMADVLNSVTKAFNPNTTSGKWDAGKLEDAYNSTVGAAAGVTQSALAFTKNALTAATINYTMQCMTSTGMLTTADNCKAGGLATADGMEQWKTSAAMQGSGFLKTMFTSMGFLQVIFFSLFPFIAIYGLVVMSKTIQVFGAYILIGIWSQSWMLVVVPIQAYIQNSVIDELSRFTTRVHGTTLGNISSVYDVLSTKLAIASDLMANSQMLALALLSGSMYALSGVVSKWGAGKHMDPTLLQKKTMDTSAMTKEMPMRTMQSFDGGRYGTTQGVTDAGASDVTMQVGYSKIGNRTKATGESSTSSATRTHDLAEKIQASSGNAIEKKQSFELATSIESAESAVGRAGAAGALIMLNALKSQGVKVGDEKAAMSTLRQAEGQAVEKLAEKDKGFLARYFSSDSAVQAEARSEAMGYAMDAVTVAGGVVAIGSGVGAGLGVAALATVGGKLAFKSLAKKEAALAASQAGAATLKRDSKAMAMMGGIAGGVGAVANGIAGQIGAEAQAIIRHAGKQTVTGSTASSGKSGRTLTADQTDRVADAVAHQLQDSFTQSSSASQVESKTTSFNHASLNKMATQGFDGKTGEQLIADSDAAVAGYMNGSMVNPVTGAAYTPTDIAKARSATAADMFGQRTNNSDIDRFKDNFLFERNLTGRVDGTLGGAVRGNMPTGIDRSGLGRSELGGGSTEFKTLAAPTLNKYANPADMLGSGKLRHQTEANNTGLRVAVDDGFKNAGNEINALAIGKVGAEVVGGVAGALKPKVTRNAQSVRDQLAGGGGTPAPGAGGGAPSPAPRRLRPSDRR